MTEGYFLCFNKSHYFGTVICKYKFIFKNHAVAKALTTGLDLVLVFHELRNL